MGRKKTRRTVHHRRPAFPEARNTAKEPPPLAASMELPDGVTRKSAGDHGGDCACIRRRHFSPFLFSFYPRLPSSLKGIFIALSHTVPDDDGTMTLFKNSQTFLISPLFLSAGKPAGSRLRGAAM